jgi:1-deoxy-D-xylulose-5-phosphate synthase
MGEMAATAMAVAEKLAGNGLRVQVVDPLGGACRSAPTSCSWLRASRPVAVIEDNLVVGGSRVAGRPGVAGSRAWYAVPLLRHTEAFLAHASRGEVLEEIGLTPDAIADNLTARMTRHDLATSTT